MVLGTRRGSREQIRNETITVLPSKSLQSGGHQTSERKAVTRGCVRAGLRIPMHGVPWEHKGKTSTADQGRLLGGVDKQMGT